MIFVHVACATRRRRAVTSTMPACCTVMRLRVRVFGLLLRARASVFFNIYFSRSPSFFLVFVRDACGGMQANRAACTPRAWLHWLLYDMIDKPHTVCGASVRQEGLARAASALCRASRFSRAFAPARGVGVRAGVRAGVGVRACGVVALRCCHMIN